LLSGIARPIQISSCTSASQFLHLPLFRRHIRLIGKYEQGADRFVAEKL